MIVLDTNIIGTLTLIGSMEVLWELFPKDKIGITPAVYAELLDGVREKGDFLQAALDMVENKTLSLVALTAEEVVQRHRLAEVSR